MNALAIEILVILFLLVLNGVFSMSELALMTAKRSRLEHRAEGGDKGARAALELAAHPTAFLSTVQFGITLVGVLAGAFGGAGISEVLTEKFETISWLARYAQPVAFGLVVTAITYLSLIIGELVPKQIALGQPERIAALMSRPMRALSRAGSPLIALLTGSTKLVFRLFGVRATVQSTVTEQDIRAMVEQGAEAGVVEAVEHEIVENTFRMGERRVSSIMTPRLDVVWIDVNATPDVLRERVKMARWSPYLVCEGSVEHVVGFLEAEDLLDASLADAPLAPRALVREPLYVPASMTVLRLLELFRESGRHAAVVLDEFGGASGMVTIDDILETLVGSLAVASDGASAEIVRQPDGSWLVEGRTALSEVLAELDADTPTATTPRVDTIGGLVMALLGRIPVEGDSVRHADLELRVERMARRRVVLLRVRQEGEGRLPGSG